MRVNEPITNHEIEVPSGEPLVSRTDRSGNIVFTNHVFVETSGFTEEELIGSPHNIGDRLGENGMDRPERGGRAGETQIAEKDQSQQVDQ